MCGQRGAGGLDERGAGDGREGRTGVGVHDAVVIDECLGPLGDDVLADAVRLGVAHGLNLGDRLFLCSHSIRNPKYDFAMLPAVVSGFFQQDNLRFELNLRPPSHQ